MPYHLQTSGVGWLIAAGVLVVLRQLPEYVGIMRGLATLSSWWVLNGLGLGLLLMLLVLRRLRHLIVSFALAYLVVTTVAVVGASIWRLRPFGVVIQAGWGGWALPSLQVTLLAAGLVGSCTRWCPRDAGATPASGWPPG